MIRFSEPMKNSYRGKWTNQKQLYDQGNSTSQIQATWTYQKQLYDQSNIQAIKIIVHVSIKNSYYNWGKSAIQIKSSRD
jgi:hypothetical protein